ncbi:hypothetical protein J6590_001115 [Homalodisca vitripennis]|nr:hypothetical protein J6590_001115 [Homalodisca vitripennis]
MNNSHRRRIQSLICSRPFRNALLWITPSFPSDHRHRTSSGETVPTWPRTVQIVLLQTPDDLPSHDQGSSIYTALRSALQRSAQIRTRRYSLSRSIQLFVPLKHSSLSDRDRQVASVLFWAGLFYTASNH